MSKHGIKIALLILSAVLPLSSYAATVVDEAKTGVSNAVSNVGDAVSDVGDAVSDTAITTAVKAKIALESDIPMDISVTTNNGVVQLSGIVSTELQANRVIELAQSVSGVKDVNYSSLKVTDSESYFSDAAITAKVKGKIMQLESDKKISSTDLHVETTNGEVHIFGSVTKSADVSVIEKAIGKIGDVKKVKTNIEVKN